MIPVDQRIIDKDVGDCWKCCIASVMDLPYDEVPHFVKAQVWYGLGHFVSCWNWLGPRGLCIETISADIVFGRCKEEEIAEFARNLPPYLIASGWSPRGDWYHAVVWDRLEQRIAHDPHPSRDGLRGGPTHFEAILPLQVDSH